MRSTNKRRGCTEKIDRNDAPDIEREGYKERSNSSIQNRENVIVKMNQRKSYVSVYIYPINYRNRFI